MIKINGKSINIGSNNVNSNITINKGNLFINGVEHYTEDPNIRWCKLEITLEGNASIENVDADCELIINGNVGRDAHAGNSLECLNIAGDAKAGNSINARDIHGNCKAGNSISGQRIFTKR